MRDLWLPAFMFFILILFLWYLRTQLKYWLTVTSEKQLQKVQHDASHFVSNLLLLRKAEKFPPPNHILIVMASSDDRPHANITRTVNKKYAEKHGYSFMFIPLSKNSSRQDWQMTQISILSRILQIRHPDYIFWIDDDAMVINPEHDIEMIISLSDEADITLCRSLSPDTAINMGVFLLKNTPFSRGLLEVLLTELSTKKEINLDSPEQSCLEDLVLTEELKNYIYGPSSSKRIESSKHVLHQGPFKSVLDHGYPIRTSHFCLLSEHVMNSESSPFLIHLARRSNEFRLSTFKQLSDQLEKNQPLSLKSTPIFPWDWSTVMLMPKHLPVRQGGTSQTRIPKILHQTFETRAVPVYLVDAVNSWISQTDYEYRYYTGHNCRQLIEEAVKNEIFPVTVLSAYDALYSGAYKADLWRYCQLYLEGGVYADIKLVLNRPLDMIIGESDTLVVVIDRMDQVRATLYNAFIACVPRHPFILATILECTRIILSRSYEDNMLAITGPFLFGRVVYQQLGWPLWEYYPEKEVYRKDDEIIRFYRHHPTKRIICRLDDEEELIYTRSPSLSPMKEYEYYEEITGRPHYSKLWKNRKVYNDL
jgi:hypothetical protein